MSRTLNTLRITEIFYSVQGEANTMGWPTVFIRLTGCPLRCHYCDTAYAFYGGQSVSLDAILPQIAQYHSRYVTVTGGEPLAQPACLPLLNHLCDAGYYVSLETSGALDISAVDQRVSRVVDIKTPSSREALRNHWSNLLILRAHDQIKFVVGDRADYEWSLNIMQQYELTARCTVLFSPSYGCIENQVLANWILEDRLPVRFQLQMHKYIWGNMSGK